MVNEVFLFLKTSKRILGYKLTAPIL